MLVLKIPEIKQKIIRIGGLFINNKSNYFFNLLNNIFTNSYKYVTMDKMNLRIKIR